MFERATILPASPATLSVPEMSHRRNLLRLLDEYQVRWPEETRCVERFRTFVQAHPDCFERELPIGHVTGSAWLVSSDGSRVLLTHHRKLGAWLQLGGHADGNADVLAVAMAEATEESGLDGLVAESPWVFDLDIHTIPQRRRRDGSVEPAHFHYDVRFAVRACGGEDFRVSDESHDLAWVRVDRLEGVEDPSVLRMAAKWRGLGGR